MGGGPFCTASGAGRGGLTAEELGSQRALPPPILKHLCHQHITSTRTIPHRLLQVAHLTLYFAYDLIFDSLNLNSAPTASVNIKLDGKLSNKCKHSGCHLSRPFIQQHCQCEVTFISHVQSTNRAQINDAVQFEQQRVAN